MKAIMLCVTSPFEVSQSRASGSRIWRTFLAGGTNHSSKAATLPYLIRRCEREGVSFRLEAHPGLGYRMEPVDLKPRGGRPPKATAKTRPANFSDRKVSE